jgi:hypothetical protein
VKDTLRLHRQVRPGDRNAARRQLQPVRQAEKRRLQVERSGILAVADDGVETLQAGQQPHQLVRNLQDQPAAERAGQRQKLRELDGIA